MANTKHWSEMTDDEKYQDMVDEREYARDISIELTKNHDEQKELFKLWDSLEHGDITETYFVDQMETFVNNWKRRHPDYQGDDS